MSLRCDLRVKEHAQDRSLGVLVDQGAQQPGGVPVAARPWIVLGIGQHDRPAGARCNLLGLGDGFGGGIDGGGEGLLLREDALGEALQHRIGETGVRSIGD